MAFRKILNIRKIKPTKKTYNIEVSPNNNYFANGILVHNCDESPLIDDLVYRKYIIRMLETEESIMVQIGNPTKLNHYFQDWNSPEYHKLKIDWERCVEDGRFSMTFIEEKARECGGWDSPIFISMYGAEFVEDSTNNLLKFALVDDAIEKEIELDENSWYELGVDVARYGTDYTVFTTIHRDYSRIKVIDIQFLAKSSNTDVYRKIASLHEKYKYEIIKIDDLGLGGGVVDLCYDANFPTQGFVASAKARGAMYANKKAECSWQLREYFQDGNISIPNYERLISDCKKMTYDYTINGKLHIVDPSDSPDFFDSLLIACQGAPMLVSSARIYK